MDAVVSKESWQEETTPYRLVDLACSRFKEDPKKCGVYIVFWIREGKSVKVLRIMATDERGVLYIGSTRDLKNDLLSLGYSPKEAEYFIGEKTTVLIRLGLLRRKRGKETIYW